MKSVFSWKILCWLLCFALFAACSDDEPDPGIVLPPLVWPDDVAAAIPDPAFRKYCLNSYNYDRDRDGRLSKDEVLAIKIMDVFTTQPIHTLEGIEYFGNLKRLILSTCAASTIDLRYNSRLEYVGLGGESLTVLRGPVGYAPLEIFAGSAYRLQTVDLSGCGNVRGLHLYMEKPGGSALTTIDLPDASHLQILSFSAAEQSVYDTLLAGAVNLKELNCNFYPGGVLDLSACAKLEYLSVRVTHGSALWKLRLRKNLPLREDIRVYDEDGERSLKVEYVE